MSSKIKIPKTNLPRVIITGMGIISSLGQGIDVLKRSLQNGKSHFRKSDRFPILSFPVIAAELNDFSFEKTLEIHKKLPDNLLTVASKVGRRAPLTIQTSIIAALEAWHHAKLHERNINNKRLGIVVAGQNTTQAYQYALHSAFANDYNYLSPSYALRFMDTDQIGTLSSIFEIKGEGFTVGGASASGNVAIIQGYRMIQQGLLDACMIVGVLADLSPLELQGFYNIGAMGGRSFSDEPHKACRPFDRRHEGFIWGQASGCLILESALLADATDKPFLGEIEGVAMALDSNQSADPNDIGESEAMQQALSNANMTPKDIQYLNAHGSSSTLGDKTELAAIHTVFEEISSLLINSTKSILGHCLWSAGVVEAIATLLQLQEGFVHPNLNLEHPIDEFCHLVGPHSEMMPLHTAMSNSFGFGGINTSIILTKGD